MAMATLARTNAFDELAPDVLQRGIPILVSSYQQTRSTVVAWFVVRYAEALCRHPDFEGSDEDRCHWHRLALHWQWLARFSERRTDSHAGEAA